MEYRPKTMSTLLGEVTIPRAYYRCGECGASSLPYDERVGLGGGQVSVGLAKAGTLLGIHEPFELASNRFGSAGIGCMEKRRRPRRCG